jgi:SNF2 family DNA or RNA helicase
MIDSGRAELLKKKQESAGKNAGDDADNKESVADSKPSAVAGVYPEEMVVPRRVYCSETFGGFRSSAKLDSIIDHFNTIPVDEKMLLVSFFKGSLDILEAIFSELNVEVARFDGDIQHEEREMELERFKTSQSCRVLLATVQTVGTGINLCEANHVVFADRFFNPTVLEQAEDRCYRLGQTRVSFLFVFQFCGEQVAVVPATTTWSSHHPCCSNLTFAPFMHLNLSLIDCT